MRTVTSTNPALFLAIATALSLGCSSDPEAGDPIVDPGVAHEGGGIEAGSGLTTGSGGVAYPTGPYGHDVGTIIQNFKFMGMVNPMEANYVADENTLSTISLADYYNPDGNPDRPVAMLVNASALWCSVCQTEAQQSVANYAYWRTRGVVFVTAIFEDNDAQPSELEDIEYWSQKFKLEYPVVLDPKLTLGVFFDKSASPFNMIINTRTMEIVKAEEGLIDMGASNPTLKQLTGE